jgi:hypothetical protein
MQPLQPFRSARYKQSLSHIDTCPSRALPEYRSPFSSVIVETAGRDADATSALRAAHARLHLRARTHAAAHAHSCVRTRTNRVRTHPCTHTHAHPRPYEGVHASQSSRCIGAAPWRTRLENRRRSASSVGVSHSFVSGHLSRDENRRAPSSVHGVDGDEDSRASRSCCASEPTSAPAIAAGALIRRHFPWFS